MSAIYSPVVANAVSAANFGAIGNGVANDSVAIQAALTAAAVSTNTRTVYLPAGTYKCNITLPPGVSLVGAGGGTSGDWTGTENSPATILTPNSNALPVILVTIVQGQRIADLGLVGNGRATSLKGVSLDNGATYPGSMFFMDRVCIKRFTTGYFSSGATDTNVTNCTIVQCTKNVSMVLSADGANADTNCFINCIVGGTNEFSGTDATSYHFNGSRGNVIQGGDHNLCGAIIDATASTITWIGGNSEGMKGAAWAVLSGSQLCVTGLRMQTGVAASVFISAINSNVTLNNCNIESYTGAFAGNKGIVLAKSFNSTFDYNERKGDEFVVAEYSDAGLTALTGYRNLRAPLNGYKPEKQLRIREEFFRLNGTATIISGGKSEYINSNPEYGQGGVVTLGTNATNGSQVRYSIGADAPPFVAMHLYEYWEIEVSFRFMTTTNQEIRIGLIGNTGVDPADGIWLRHSTTAGDTTFKFECKSASASTVVNSGVTVNAAYHRLRIIRHVAGSVSFVLDGVNVGSITTNIPTGYLTPGATFKTLEADFKYLDMDYFRLDVATP